ncbi:unnamed protein product [Sphagnum jensenii]|uniref:DDE-1 domain-containing protein n=1 Tax=Sphagnum jensenii TaxID=128206 RepID=A0ABP1A7A9_9BRYO
MIIDAFSCHKKLTMLEGLNEAPSSRLLRNTHEVQPLQEYLAKQIEVTVWQKGTGQVQERVQVL